MDRPCDDDCHFRQAEAPAGVGMAAGGVAPALPLAGLDLRPAIASRIEPRPGAGVLAPQLDAKGPARRPIGDECPATSLWLEARDRAPPLCIRTLGGFALAVDREAVHFQRKAPRRALELLKCIVALGADGVNRDGIASALWPDSEGDAARTVLEVTLHRLRNLLGYRDAVRLSNGTVRLDPSIVWIDAVAFEALADRANGERGAIDLDAALRALALYGGPFLQNDLETPWLLPRRDRLRSRYVRLAVRTARSFERAGDLGQAVEICANALEAEPVVEELHRMLVECLARLDRRAEAILAYRRCQRILSVVLGTRPSQETEEACAVAVRSG